MYETVQSNILKDLHIHCDRNYIRLFLFSCPLHCIKNRKSDFFKGWRELNIF